jgi:hypothetical protein
MLKIRCSQIGKIMTNPKKKTDILSQTTKTYLEELKIGAELGLRKDIESKYMTKGTLQEDYGIDLYLDYKGLPFGIKNQKHYENEFITGTPDLILEDKVIDIKCPWDAFNMPYFQSDIPNKDYYYQLMGYMALTSMSKAELAYTLVNTPDHLRYSLSDSFDYTEVETAKRVVLFSVDYDQSVVDSIYSRVGECRDYYNNLKIG